ncbi:MULTISPECIES: sugar phosphate nucleotidyltransferase [unclassified Mucilaginibacter]|uniref:nucleotidyltransferase family protein n=1 Tax=unclassified Mucilaginibacter TaxID=2617802 RepID=UPI002AC96977|nr:MULTISPECIES: sugar phosphate nucleotidyltransferase [unclassified Mucilaginibacter]MEB0263734.1 sugar phosphate nucleotidyltransferase [Mucilaginibacter sp. 10I4]MEB0278010.1 sugar phosphate nucleotidyltransferase [Mucilaginibacter sp. 10B2]MEB0299637.1 sugar phosphate nucleotidyltransferase [Mucilaginibacter sp. 5C4]WPX22899.1 sugar phosphate nucleotidyltransferase [Mucilaginibacter sp. 5C4]
MKPTLLILAAGMASRYGSMKQVDGFGPNGETIIDYSIYDAIKAGFGKVSFIIREEFAEPFKAIFDPKLAGRIETDYVFQSFDLEPFGISEKIERAKPWGTAHAVLAARNQINEPFCVINADDYYGYDAFEKMAKFLTTEVDDNKYAIIGYQIDKTLSDHGTVSRGVCAVDDNGNMTEVTERTEVYFKEDGTVAYKDATGEHGLANDTRVSMNFWGFTPAVFGQSEELFRKFVEANKTNPKSEFFIPLVADELIKSGTASFKVIPTATKWFGVTYKEDKPIVQNSISQLVNNGTYPSNLWS